MDHSDWRIVQKIVDNITANFNNAKFRTVNKLQIRSKPLLEYLISNVGFVEQGNDRLVLINVSQEDWVKNVVPIVQKGVDESRNPDTISFAQVAEILGRDGTLPGIDTTIDDTPLGEWDSVAEMDAPIKPWQLDSSS